MERDRWLHKFGLILVVTLYLLYLSNDCVFFSAHAHRPLACETCNTICHETFFYYADTNYSVQTG